MSLDELDLKFRPVPRHFLYVTDHAGEVTTREYHALEHWLKFSERRFPQVKFAVFIAETRPECRLREYGFWLINRCRFSPSDTMYEQNFTMLLLIDPRKRRANLTAGYGLEPYVSEEELQQILAAGESAYRKDAIYKGALRSLMAAMKILRRNAKKAQRELKKQQRQKASGVTTAPEAAPAPAASVPLPVEPPLPQPAATPVEAPYAVAAESSPQPDIQLEPVYAEAEAAIEPEEDDYSPGIAGTPPEEEAPAVELEEEQLPEAEHVYSSDEDLEPEEDPAPSATPAAHPPARGKVRAAAPPPET